MGKRQRQKLLRREINRRLAKYPACEHLNQALWYLLKKPEENREAIGEIVYAIVKSGGYIHEIYEEALKEMGVIV